MNPTAEIADFIRQGFFGGKSADELREALASAGWAAADIDAAFASLETKTPGKKRRLLLWLAIGASVLVAVGGGALLLIQPSFLPSVVRGGSGDDASIDDASLFLPSVELVAEENAYFVISPGFSDIDSQAPAAWSALIGPSADLPKSWNPQTSQDILFAYKDDLAAFLAAAPRARYQDPVFSVPAFYDEDVPTQFGQMRALVRIAGLDSYTKAQNGSPASARSEALLIADYGYKVAVAQGNTANFLFGLSVNKIGLDAWLAINRLAAPSPEDLEAMGKRLDVYTGNADALAAAFKFEYLAYKKSILDLAKNGDPSDSAYGRFYSNRFLFEPNKTLNKAAALTRRRIAATKEACHDFIDDSAPTEEMIEAYQKLNMENALGELLLRDMEIGAASVQNARCAQVRSIDDFRGRMSQTPSVIQPEVSAEPALAAPSGGEADFVLPKTDVPAANNAFLSPEEIGHLSGMSDAEFAQADALARASTPGDKTADALALKAQKLIDAFIAASAKTSFQMPELSDASSIDAVAANAALKRLRSVANLVALDAKRRLAAGDAAGASVDALAIVAYGQKMAMSRSTLNGYGVGMTLRELGLGIYSSPQNAAAFGKLASGDAGKALAAIKALAETGSGLVSAMKMNYWLNKSLVNNIVANSSSLPPNLAAKSGDPFYFDAQATIEGIAAFERQGIAIASAKCASRAEPPAVTASQLDQMAKATYKNAVGEYILAIVKGQSNEFWNNWRCSRDFVNAAIAALSGK
jgi:hypothetical protein